MRRLVASGRGFHVKRREPDYVGPRRGQGRAGLAPLSHALPAGDEPGFTQERVRRWGLRDFRIADSDGYNVRVTAG